MKRSPLTIFLFSLLFLAGCGGIEPEPESVEVDVVMGNGMASVSSDSELVKIADDGGYVTLDFTAVKKASVRVNLRGVTDDGAVKIYSGQKCTIVLDGASIRSRRGAAINCQSHEPVTVLLEEGSVNQLSDEGSPADVASSDEDDKGCLFTEGDLTLTGDGILTVKGYRNHAICSDDRVTITGEPVISVPTASHDAIFAKGREDVGILIDGGTIVASLNSSRGKCINSDGSITISGGNLVLSSDADAWYDNDKAKKRFSSCIKSDREITISGGTIAASCGGVGGKVIRAKGTITVTGGYLDIRTDKLDAEGIESKAKDKNAVLLKGGQIKVVCNHNCINSNGQIVFAGSDVYALSYANDAVDSNWEGEGAITVSAGTVVAMSANGSPEEALDSDDFPLVISGGTLFALGGAQEPWPSLPSATTAIQPVACVPVPHIGTDSVIRVSDSLSSAELYSIAIPFSLSGCFVTLSLPSLQKGGSYLLAVAGDTIEFSTL